MKKKYFLITFILLPILMITSGCGVNQEKYDAIVTERDAALAEVTGLTNDLELARTEAVGLERKIKDLEASLVELESELADARETVETQLTTIGELKKDVNFAQGEASSAQSAANTANSELIAIEQSLEKSRLLVELVTDWILVPEFEMSPLETVRWLSLIEKINIDSLTEAYLDYMNSPPGSMEEEICFLEYIIATGAALKEVFPW